MKITQLTIEGVPGFREPQTLEIRPLTFLVGENLTGKTTALNCYRILMDYLKRGRDALRPGDYPGPDDEFHLSFGYELSGETNVRRMISVVFFNTGIPHIEENDAHTPSFIWKNAMLSVHSPPDADYRLLGKPTSAVLDKLTAFGRNADLFQEVDIYPSDTPGLPGGYRWIFEQDDLEVMPSPFLGGIYEFLPTAVRILMQQGIHLIRNPETGLHPKTQAAIVTWLFIPLATSTDEPHSFVIETHSDAMIDRARIDIRQGRISYKDVSLIYFESNRSHEVRVHNISFDKMANLINVPEGYRDFFLKETDRLMGFD